MKILNNNQATTSQYISLKNHDWLKRQRVAGRVTALALRHLRLRVEEGTTLTTAELSAEAEAIILEQGCTPTFKNYKGFPHAVCISVNEQLVHGIPNDYRLKDGDVVSFDLGATFEGSIADSAQTMIFGKPKNEKHIQLIQATKKALQLAIDQVAVGKRLGCIGNAIYNYGREQDLSVIVNYGGHGICNNPDGSGRPHAPPFVANRADPNEGIVIQAGLTIAIEPMFILGSSNKTKISDDGWTVISDNIGSHEENTIFVHEDRVEIITAID